MKENTTYLSGAFMLSVFLSCLSYALVQMKGRGLLEVRPVVADQQNQWVEGELSSDVRGWWQRYFCERSQVEVVVKSEESKCKCSKRSLSEVRTGTMFLCHETPCTTTLHSLCSLNHLDTIFVQIHGVAIANV